MLSAKSSGSSALQSFLVKYYGAEYITHTRHYEHETLYWVKAASILGLPQPPMLQSAVLIPKKKAKRDLLTLIKDNIPSFESPIEDNSLVMIGWQTLCKHCGPFFVEKSPHYLHQWSTLELIKTYIESYPHGGVVIIGLVRNLVDTLFSMWIRFVRIQ